jgi:hypothetical protein
LYSVVEANVTPWEGYSQWAGVGGWPEKGPLVKPDSITTSVGLSYENNKFRNKHKIGTKISFDTFQNIRKLSFCFDKMLKQAVLVVR